MKKILPLLALLFWGATSPTLPAQARDNGRDYAVFFVASAYKNGWTTLSEAPAEVRAIAAELRARYGFSVRIVRAANRDSIEQALARYKVLHYDPQDQLLLFFSMHGIREGNKKGYLIPENGLQSDPVYQTWFSHDQLADIAATIPCPRVLVAIDACHSGLFGGHRGDKTPKPIWETEEYKCRERLRLAFANDQKTRKYVTAGGDQRVPAASRFAARWLAALRNEGGDDGLLSFRELMTYLDEYIDPRPTEGDFDPATAGDFVLVKKGGCADLEEAQKTTPPETPEQRSLRDLSAWATADAAKNYQKYLDDWCPGGAFCEAAEAKIKAAAKPDNMVFIKGGPFQMGSNDGEDDEKPVHTVTVSDFYLSKYEVTVAEFRAFVEATGYETDAEKNGGEGSYFWDSTTTKQELEPGINWRHDAEDNTRPSSEDSHPVIHVSWNDAMAYCEWLSKKTGKTYRLPTEAEWEYAAGNGSRHTKYSWGNGDPAGKKGGSLADETGATKFKLTEKSTYIFMGYADGYATTAPVGSFDANDFGLHDMNGNIWEWCSDWYASDYYQNSPSRNPTGASSGSYRVQRGGSWSDGPQDCRVSVRFYEAPGYRDYSTGFRLARSK